jgi:large-conductance mechanosensitive channel
LVNKTVTTAACTTSIKTIARVVRILGISSIVAIDFLVVVFMPFIIVREIPRAVAHAGQRAQQHKKEQSKQKCRAPPRVLLRGFGH